MAFGAPRVRAKRGGRAPLNGFHRRWVRIGLLALGLAACGPVLHESPAGPGVPRISNLKLVPRRVIAGCPVTARFHFEDVEGDMSRAVAHWILTPQQQLRTLARDQSQAVDSGTVTIAVQPTAFAGKTRGEVQSRLTADRPGTYWYHFQVEDAVGRRSNVLEAVLVVDVTWPFAKGPGEC